MSILAKIIRLSVLLILVGLLSLILPRLFTEVYSLSLIKDIESTPSHPVAIVFGAGLWRDGSPTPVLEERVNTAVELYFSGKVEKILMSGDNRFWNYNEPAAMRAHALSRGVPDEDIVMDYAGRRTYDTCYRAAEIFHVDQAILVTQKYHLSRALYLCNTLGVSSYGVAAQLPPYSQNRLLYWQIREVGATVVAVWEAKISRPLPVLGNPEPILSFEAQ
ncbi:MAG: YdcF family protein [Anaerolineales bacterium]|nr:YdcF family protein [Anaerolineales bacterium]